ncbi:MAG: phosphoribosylformylglycinamidine cyclo-ligase [Planctomycetaceae bacterium]
MTGLTYGAAGVDAETADGEKAALGRVLAASLTFRKGLGASLLEHGYYASAVRVTDRLAVAITTDGVGSKLLVAEEMGKLDTIGIDCVAMNVNDLICVGAEPICMVDYIALERLNPGVLEQVARGLLEGARQANISIPGGETAQLPEIIRGKAPGKGLDLAGTAIGLVEIDKINTGRGVAPGQLVVGLASTGLHSNGFSLARRALFSSGKLSVASRVQELGRTVGEELLVPTRIYVREIVEMLQSGLGIKAMLHITGDGLLNLPRVQAPVAWELDALPPHPPIFDLIRECGGVEWAEMYRTFNMGVGFCLVLEERDVDAACRIARKHGSIPQVIGRVVGGPAGEVRLTRQRLVAREAGFVPV